MTRNLSVLQRATAADVQTDPFPYLVISNALPDDLYAELAATWPSREDTGITEARNNQRWNYPARKLVENERITPLWRDFIAYHSSEGFFREFTRLFQPAITQLFPERFPSMAMMEKMSVGMREVQTFAERDALLEAMVAGNTAVDTPSSVRSTHVDLGDKLFSGLFYMRPDNYEAIGGDLTISRFKPAYAGRKERYDLFSGAYVDDEHVDVVKTVPYAKNTVVLFVNSLDSLHGVTIRQPTPHERIFVNLVGEIDPPLYKITKGKPARPVEVETAGGLRLPRWLSNLGRRLAS